MVSPSIPTILLTVKRWELLVGDLNKEGKEEDVSSSSTEGWNVERD
jgi:hypothetical protein